MMAGCSTSKDFTDLLQPWVNDILKVSIYDNKKEMVKKSRFKLIFPLHM